MLAMVIPGSLGSQQDDAGLRTEYGLSFLVPCCDPLDRGTGSTYGTGIVPLGSRSMIWNQEPRNVEPRMVPRSRLLIANTNSLLMNHCFSR